MEVELPDGRILEFPEGTSRDVMRTAIQRLLANETAPASGGTAQADIDAGLVPSGDTDTRSTAELVGQPGGAGMDQARSLSGPMFEGAGAALRGATGQGPSIVGGMLEQGVNLGYGDPVQVPSGVAQGVGRVADLGLAGLSAIGGLGAGAAGAVGDVAEAAGVPNADRLGRELAAIPEAFAGSPAQFAGMVPRGAVTAARAGQAAPSAARSPTPATGSASRLDARASDPARVGQTVRAAAGGRASAQRRLAGMTDVDPQAAAAADRLGVDVPADVLSNNQIIKEAAGLTRSIAGTPASAGWRDTIVNAAERATEAMQRIGGSTDLSQVSSNVLNSLRGTREGLKTQASKLYDAVDEAVPRGTIIEPENTVRALNAVLGDLGGEAGMSAAERSLFKMVTNPDQPVTYERLMREKRAVQRALRSQDGPYGDADQFILRQVERALVQDQLSNVERIGGEGLRGNLELANRLTAQQKGLEENIISAFGRDGEGSIANALRTAVNSAKKGDLGNLNRVMNVIPEELQGEAMASAIMAASQSNRATDPGFGFAEFSKLYRGMRENSQVYNRVVKSLGPQADRTMRDLYEISKRITDARGNVLTTGKANQALVGSMTAEGLVSRVLNTSLGRNMTRVTSAGTGAAMGGPVGAGAAASASETFIRALTNRGASRLEQAGKLFSSPDFQRLATEAATAQPQQSTIRRAANSAAMRSWAAANNIENPVQWLEAALLASSQAQSTQEAEN